MVRLEAYQDDKNASGFEIESKLIIIKDCEVKALTTNF